MLLIQHAQPVEDPVERVQKHPWIALLLIKWILIDDQFNDRNRPPAAPADMRRLMNLGIALSDAARLPSQYDHPRLFIRALAHQQFPYQLDFSVAGYARQGRLFRGLERSHKLRIKFVSEVGLDIEDFLNLSGIVAMAVTMDKMSAISEDYFVGLNRPDLDALFRSYMRELAFEPLKCREFLVANSRSIRDADEYVEQSPLFRKPFIKIGSRYYLYHPSMLYCAVENCLHDRLRSGDAQLFMQYFGKIFENHIQAVLAETGADIIFERDLKVPNGPSKQVDFIINEPGVTIYVDAKGVAGRSDIMVHHSSERVQRGTQNSAMCAIEQALKVNEWLRENGNASTQKFLIVITYQELHLGNGQTYHDSVAGGKITKLYQSVDFSSELPLDHIYFMGIESFELLCAAVSRREITFRDALLRAKESDADSKMMKFRFLQHLGSWGLRFNFPKLIADQVEIEQRALAIMFGVPLSELDED